MGFGGAFVLQDHVAATFGAGLGITKNSHFAYIDSKIEFIFALCLVKVTLAWLT